MSEQETPQDKNARLRKEKAGRQKEADDRRIAGENLCLELEAKYEAEYGPINVAFAMVFEPLFGVDGIIVVKPGSDLNFRRYCDAVVSAADADTDPIEVFNFVAPALVYPTAEKFAELNRTRGRLTNRAADALQQLHGVKQKKIEGKF